MLASGSAVQKIPESPERTKKEQKTAELPIAQVNGKCFSANQWYRLKVYSPNECPSRSQPTRCQQPKHVNPKSEIFLVPEIHLSHPVGRRKKSIDLVVKFTPSKNGGDVVGKFRQTKTLLLQICVVPPLSENWGYVLRLFNGAGVRDT